MSMPNAQQQRLTSLLSNNIAYRIATEASIIHPTRGRIRFIPRKYQRDLWLDHSRLRLILKARQIGMSQAVAAEALYKAMLTPNRTILFISKNGPDAIRLLKQARDIYDALKQPACKATKSILNEMHFANGSSIVSVAAQRNAGRGYPASDIYFDEAAFAQFADDIYISIIPAIAQGGTLTVLSTPNGQQGLFFDLWQGMYGEEWSKHKIPFWKCPTYDQAWYESERKKLTESQFASEYECSFEASGAPVFRGDAVEFCAEGWMGLGPAFGNRVYINAWDIARRRDFTVGVTLDITEPQHHIVAFERYQNLLLPVQQQLVAARWKKYHGLTIVEGNNQGDGVIENLPPPASGWVLRDYHLTQLLLAGVDIPWQSIVSFQTQVRSKENIITALQLAVEGHTFKHAIPEVREEMLKYQREDKRLTQDTIMACAMAEWASQHVPLVQVQQMDERVDISKWDR